MISIHEFRAFAVLCFAQSRADIFAAERDDKLFSENCFRDSNLSRRKQAKPLAWGARGHPEGELSDGAFKSNLSPAQAELEGGLQLLEPVERRVASIK